MLFLVRTPATLGVLERAIHAAVVLLVGGMGALVLLVGPADAAEVKVLSAGAVKAVVPELAEAFRRETGHTVILTFDTVGALRKRAATEPADLLILSDEAVDDLTRQGIVVPGSRMDIARVGIGMGARQGAPPPDISTPEALKQTLLGVKSLAYMDPARGATSGIHFAKVLERLGIAEAMRDRTVLWPSGSSADAIVAGRAEVCVQQMSEILPVAGVTVVGPLPRVLQKVTTDSGGLAVKAESPAAAQAFLAYLGRPAFKARFAAAGLDYRE
jgi:molybdate transport system substrate-binding protein